MWVNKSRRLIGTPRGLGWLEATGQQSSLPAAKRKGQQVRERVLKVSRRLWPRGAPWATVASSEARNEGLHRLGPFRPLGSAQPA